MTQQTPFVDQPVRDEIRTALDMNLCVEAGAGTGKTTSLVDRIVEILASGRTNVDGLAVITFTEKAAAELSSRVREQLERATRAEEDGERRARLEEAARSLYRARMETIHSFAASLLRQRPVEARLDPGFTVLDRLEADLSFDAAYERWLTSLMAGEHDEVESALNVGLGLDDIRNVAERLHEHRFLLPLREFDRPSPDPDGVVNWLARHLDELRAVEDACANPEDRGLPGLRRLIRFAERCAEEGTSDRARQRLVALHSPLPSKTAGSQASWPGGECKRMKDLIKEYRDLCEEARCDLRTAALLDVLPHAARFAREYAEERHREGTADFDDLLIWARDLLRDELEVRRYFQDRFDCVLIDEFQDTDPIQVEIAAYLTSDGQDGTDWRELRPAPGKLFVVGDPKQSIYRFRRADIAIYDEVKRGMLAGETREIVQNFRSLPGVIEWLNRSFDALFVEREGIQPANVRLAPIEGGVEHDREHVVLVRGGDDGDKADDLREKEAAAIATLLRRAVLDEGWPVRDRASGEARGAQWRDVAILLPARTGLEAYEQALARADIPFRHEGSRDYFKRQEVRELVAILRAIEDPTDLYSLVGALRSGAFGCSDEDVVVHKATAGPRLDYRLKREGASDAVNDAFAVLRRLHYVRGEASLPELVQRAVGDSKLVEVALMQRDGTQAAANLLAIVDQARAFSAAGGGGLRAFARWLVDSTENEASEVDAGIAEEADDVVRLLTMHGAKGLEFPIVVTANLATAASPHKEPIPDEPERRLHLRAGKREESGGRGYYATPEYDDRWDEEKEARRAELVRLLYVAATRARDHLIVPWFEGRRATGYLELLEPALRAVDGEGLNADGAWLLEAAELGSVEAASSEAAAEQVGRKRIEAVLGERSRWSADHAERVREARRELSLTVASSVERSTRPLAAEASHSEATLLVSEGPPLPVGDALHLVMQRVALVDGADLEAVADAVCAEADLVDRRDEVVEMARRCLATASVRRAISSGAYHREVPFTVPGEDGFATGRVDLVFREGEGLVVVDYKTDEVAAKSCESQAHEHHSGQAEVYARAIGEATGLPVGKVVFVFCRPGVEVALSV